MGKDLPIAWAAVKALYLTDLYTFVEIADLFGISDGTIRPRAMREHWNLEKGKLTPKQEKQKATAQRKAGKNSSVTVAAAKMLDTLATKSSGAGRENFRQRVADEVERVIATLKEFEDPQTDRDADLRIGVIEKAEKVGSRCYGFDDKSGVNILINLRALDQEPVPFNEDPSSL